MARRDGVKGWERLDGYFGRLVVSGLCMKGGWSCVECSIPNTCLNTQCKYCISQNASFFRMLFRPRCFRAETLKLHGVVL